ncbi:hypothetical protein Tco_0480302 [Tanacetum coccineum]
MSMQQDIYAAGFETRPPMLNKENYVPCHDIMSIVQNPTVVETFDLQIELETYNDMQQKIERFQARLGDLKGKCEDTPCVSDTLDPFSQKLENENVEFEFQVLNYAKENAHLKTTYKNLFDSIFVTRTQTKTIIDYLQNKLHDTIYENAKLRAKLFNKVSEQKEIIKGTSANTKFANQSTSGTKFYSVTPFPNSKIIPKVVELNDLINPSKTSWVDNDMPNKPVKATVRTNQITVSQPHVITKKHVNSDSNGLSSTGVDNTAKTKKKKQKRHLIHPNLFQIQSRDYTYFIWICVAQLE